MTQYLISVIDDEASREEIAAMTLEDMQPLFEKVGAFNDQLQAQGAWVFAGGLEPIETATCVDGTGDGAPLVTDGPYVETKEHLGGFWIIEAADLDAALAWAAQGSKACGSKVEVRPLQGE